MGSLGVHGDSFVEVADLHREIDLWTFLHVYRDRSCKGLFESLFLDGDVIATDLQRACDVLALRVGVRNQACAAVHIGDCDFRVGNQRAARILHRACDCTCVLLRDCDRARKNDDDGTEKQATVRAQGRAR